MDRRFAMRIGAIRMNRFARIDSQKTPIFITRKWFARIASNPQFAIFSPTKRDLQRRGPVRELWNDSRESGNSRESANRFARICGSIRAKSGHLSIVRLFLDISGGLRPPCRAKEIQLSSGRSSYRWSACRQYEPAFPRIGGHLGAFPPEHSRGKAAGGTAMWLKLYVAPIGAFFCTSVSPTNSH